MSHDESSVSPHHLLIFDHVVTNQDGSYNPHIGVFIAPEHGFYVFSWTVACGGGNYVHTEIVRNSKSIGQILTNSRNSYDWHSVTGLIATELNANDVVSVRTHSTLESQGTILSRDGIRTSFTGWKLN